MRIRSSLHLLRTRSLRLLPEALVYRTILAESERFLPALLRAFPGCFSKDITNILASSVPTMTSPWMVNDFSWFSQAGRSRTQRKSSWC
jgi:hypothetical protein